MFKKLKTYLSALLIATGLALATPVPAQAAANDYTVAVSTTFSLPTGSVFHYMDPSGNDACDGTSPSLGSSGACAWLTPNHAMKCGEVIIAAAGTYGNANSPNYSFGPVSGCGATGTEGSSSGGIDGNGGILFAILLCGGTDLEACKAITTSGGYTFDVANSHWAVEGFKCTNTVGSNAACYIADGKTAQVDYVAFINDISYASSSGFSILDDTTHNLPPTGKGVDFWAVVGSIAQDSARNTICLGAIDGVAPVTDPNISYSGTHIYLDSNYAYASSAPSCPIDVEGLYFDTPDAHGYSAQAVLRNNLSWFNGSAGQRISTQNFNTTTGTFYFISNTSYADAQATNRNAFCCGNTAIQENSAAPTIFWQKNIALTDAATRGASSILYAIQIGGSYANVTMGGTGNENIWKGLASSCIATCDPGNNAVTFGVLADLGTEIYANPNFTNTSDLLTNWVGTPTCHFENVAQCMGWDASTNTLTPNTPISDLTATGTCGSIQCNSRGYQKPKMGCASDVLFPTWLKGVVYLHWDGTKVLQKAGLAAVPCGM